MKSICLIILSLFAANVFAGSVSVPNTFQPNTPALSGQVNANFDALVVAVNAMQAQIDAQALTISQLQAQVAVLEGNSVLALDGFLSLDTDPDGRNVARFDSINVQITNGLGATNGDPGSNPEDAGPVNGLGNLIVGYNERDTLALVICSDAPYDNQVDCEANGEIWAGNQRTGSHNLVIGPAHSYTRHGGLLAGYGNAVNNIWAGVSGGLNNLASGNHSHISAGNTNIASGSFSSVSGGLLNTASGPFSSVSGGQSNEASSISSSVSGGRENTASGLRSSVSGGLSNIANGDRSSVSGGRGNTASGLFSSVSGGATRTAAGADDWAAGSLFEGN